MEIQIPHHYKPRDYQLPILRAMDSGYLRAVWLAHRRAGKDKTMLNLMIKKMIERVGTYYYFFPTFTQAKRVLWEGTDKDGFRFLDHFPKELIDGEPNSTEMKIRLKNGSLFQLVGTDNFDSIRGTNPIGCVFSEYPWQDPRAWDVVRPILAENGGWAVFVYTPFGKNHGHTLYEMAKTNPNWFVSRLTVDDTNVISKETIEEERKSGMSQEMIDQEYYLSFEGMQQGAYYANELRKMDAEKRETRVAYEAGIPVDTFWDIGFGDSTSIWFMQVVGRELHFIDYLEATGESIAFYAQELQKKGYVYNRHYFPHDAGHHELGTGKTIKESAEALGLRPIEIVPMVSVQDGINATRLMFNRFWFDADKCKRGLEALRNYCKDWDEKLQQFRSKPRHDWASHCADALRMCAVGLSERKGVQSENLLQKRIQRSRHSAVVR